MSFWDELKERKLVQWTLAYVAFGIAVLEILNAVEAPFAIPAALIRVAMVLVGVGLLVTLVLAWFHGERGHQRPSLAEVALLLGIAGAGAGAVVVAWRPEPGERARVPSAAEGYQSAARAAAQRNSIAVIPFRNLSGNPQDEYFSDGITEELTNALGELPGLQVASRTSAFQFKNRSVDVRQVGSQLGVAAVLEGSVQRAGSRLRIIATLVDAGTGFQIWRQHIDADARDIFAAEDSISRSVARALQIKLALARTPTENARPTDPLAHQTYLKGRSYAGTSDPDTVRMAQQQFRAATERDPGFAPAFAGLASSFVTLGKLGMMPQAEAADSARHWARRALELDSTLPEVHVVLARAAEHLAQRVGELRKALALNPSNVEAREELAEVMAAMGQRDSALAQAREAAALDRSARGRRSLQRIQFMVVPHPPGAPEPPPVAGSVPGVPDPARMHAEFCRDWSAQPALASTGAAARECERARRDGAGDPDVLGTVALGFARLGRRGDALDAVHAAERLAPDDPARAVNAAAVEAALGDLDAAFALLRRQEPARLRGLLDDPQLAPLRRDPRFAELRRSVGG